MPSEYDNRTPADDPKTNPNHLARLAAGYPRNEEAAKRKDRLAEEAARDAENGGSLSSDALKPEREILNHLDMETGNWPISNRQPGRYYVGVHKDNITIAAYRGRGYQMVQGDDPEAIEFKGMDAAGGSSMRGLGDTLLMWIPEELRQAWEERNIRKAIAVGAISLDEGGPELAWEDAANDPRAEARQMGAMAHARRTDAKLRSTVFSGTAGQLERLNLGIKEGNIPGFADSMKKG